MTSSSVERMEQILKETKGRLAELEEAHESHRRACFEAGWRLDLLAGMHGLGNSKAPLPTNPVDAYDEWSSEKEMT